MNVQVIVGSTRPGRATLSVAKWAAAEATNVDGVTVEIVDLQDYPMPFFNEAISPRYNSNRQPAPEVQKWLDKLTEADAYVFVTPEYNHSTTGVLKNALDFLTYEMKQKPATVVSHGSVGGARATIHLKEILSETAATIISSSVQLVGMVAMGGLIDDDGNLDETVKANPYGPHGALVKMWQDLVWHANALKAARS